jgi:hypothetical protein
MRLLLELVSPGLTPDEVGYRRMPWDRHRPVTIIGFDAVLVGIDVVIVYRFRLVRHRSERMERFDIYRRVVDGSILDKLNNQKIERNYSMHSVVNLKRASEVHSNTPQRG